MGRAHKLPRIDEYKLGPEPDGIRICIKCEKPIQREQLWLKQWAPNNEYAVGVHIACLAANQQPRGDRASVYRECTLCGHLSKDEAEAALHFRFVHRISYGVALNVLLGA